MIVRPYRPRDAEAIVHLYNSHSDSPNPVSGGIVEEEFQSCLLYTSDAADE